MANGARRKNFLVKRRKKVTLKEKDVFYDLTYFDKKKKNGSQYLYVDPTFMMEATNNNLNRLKGGFAQDEIYYDCISGQNEEHLGNEQNVECVENVPGILQQQMHVLDVITEITNAKEFKGLLKQMAFTSNILYRTFKQAYSNTKKNKTNSANPFCMENAKCCETMGRGDTNTLEIIDVELPTCKLNDCDNSSRNLRKKEKPKKDKFLEKTKKIKDQKPVCYECEYFPKCNNDQQEKICPICLGTIEDESIICCENFPAQPSNAEKEKFLIETPNEDDKNCLKESNVCDLYDKELEHLNYCDRCAVLRGEMPPPPPPPPQPKKTEITSETSDKLTQVSQEISAVKLCSTPKLAKQSKQSQPQTSKHILNLNPVCVTIPLKLQVDGQNCQTRFIETEIVMEAFAGQNKTTVPKPKIIQKPTLPIAIIAEVNPTVGTADKVQDKFGSDMFYSCRSSSGILKTAEPPKNFNEKALNDLIEMMKKTMPTIPETTEPKSPKAVVSEGIRPPEVPKPSTTKTESTQTTEIFNPVVMAPQADPRVKAKQLRAELLEEVKTALAQTTTLLALKSLKEGRRFSLPTTLQPKDIPNVRPARHSFPDNYQVLPATLAPPPRPLAFDLPPIPPFKDETQANPIPPERVEIEDNPTLIPPLKIEGHIKPAPPPKPAIAPKPVQFATAQTEASSVKPSGHFKRNDFRNEIQDELKELLEPSPSKAPKSYEPDERDEILLDLNKLFHPRTAGILPKQVSCENALQDIRYLLDPDAERPEIVTPPEAKKSESQESIVDRVRHILNPKLRQKAKKKKYTKETKDKILEDLHILLTPRKQKSPKDREIRDSVLEDLIFMLDTGLDTESHFRPPRTGAPHDSGAGPSNSKQVRQESQRDTTNELKESFRADLIHLLESNNLPQSNNSRKTDATRRPTKDQDEEDKKTGKKNRSNETNETRFR